MKKVLTITVMLIVIIFPTMGHAAVGNIARTLYNTDILTYLDGKPIRGYSLDGRMMICVEDLADYGYTVEYDDSIRALFANKTGKPSEDFNPSFARGTEGGFAGYTYETDIRVFINGMETEAENIGGRMVVVAEDIADTDAGGCNKTTDVNPNAQYGYSEYFLRHTYDDSKRVLYIETMPDGMIDYKKQIDDFLNGVMTLPTNGDLTGVPTVLARKDTDDCTMIFYQWEWLRGLAKFYKNGVQIQMGYNIFGAYSFQNQMTVTVDSAEFSEDGNFCYVKGSRYKRAGMVVDEPIESGTYALDTGSFVLQTNK